MHSPEPYRIEGPPADADFDGYYRILDSNGVRIATVMSDTVHGKLVGSAWDTAARIVVCVNALAGIPTSIIISQPIANLVNAWIDLWEAARKEYPDDLFLQQAMIRKVMGEVAMRPLTQNKATIGRPDHQNME